MPTIYNHDVYLSADNSGVVVSGNIFAHASSHGLQARSGGVVQNNLFIDDAIAMSYGLVNGSPMTAGGVSGTVSGNVILGGDNIGPLTRGGGIEIGNIAPGGNTTITDNLFADGLPTAWRLSSWKPAGRHQPPGRGRHQRPDDLRTTSSTTGRRASAPCPTSQPGRPGFTA